MILIKYKPGTVNDRKVMDAFSLLYSIVLSIYKNNINVLPNDKKTIKCNKGWLHI